MIQSCCDLVKRKMANSIVIVKKEASPVVNGAFESTFNQRMVRQSRSITANAKVHTNVMIRSMVFSLGWAGTSKDVLDATFSETTPRWLFGLMALLAFFSAFTNGATWFTTVVEQMSNSAINPAQSEIIRRIFSIKEEANAHP